MMTFVLGAIERMALYAIIAEIAMFVRFERESQGLGILIALIVYVFSGSMKDAIK